MATQATLSVDDFLYARIANRVEIQIKQHVLKCGDKLPSVRALSQEQGISISTAYKAYVELENMGLIEARPKSGYYVKFSQSRFTRPPEIKPPLKNIEQASVEQMIALVYRNMAENDVVRLSRSTPSLNLIPVAKLSKSMKSNNSAKHEIQQNIDDSKTKLHTTKNQSSANHENQNSAN